MKLLAVDTGKTKTFAVVVSDSLEVAGSRVAGPADVSLEREVVLKNLKSSVEGALRDAGIGLDDVDLIVISWAGLDTRPDHELARRYAEEVGLPMSKVVIEHDAVTAFYAVTW
ncbi:MAG: hypothetical protein DRO12_05550, partial [Thermoprotei archaeon]